MVITNYIEPLPMRKEERRYCLIDTSNELTGNNEYFA